MPAHLNTLEVIHFCLKTYQNQLKAITNDDVDSLQAFQEQYENYANEIDPILNQYYNEAAAEQDNLVRYNKLMDLDCLYTIQENIQRMLDEFISYTQTIPRKLC